MNGRRTLIGGDLFVLAAITLIGFATHDELGGAPVLRMLATFVPLGAGWFLAAPWLGLLDEAIAANPRELWRPLYACLLAVPFAAWGRSMLLNSGVVIPIFVAALTFSTAIGMTAWRTLWWALNRK